jgi:hypothetical protein
MCWKGGFNKKGAKNLASRMKGVLSRYTSITIIDTIIHHIHPKHAYIYDTYQVHVRSNTSITIIDTIIHHIHHILHIHTNDAYI